MPRQLPEIDIAGNRFIVDLQADHIAAARTRSGFKPVLFNEMDGPDSRPRFLLDTHTLTRFIPPAGMRRLPSHVACVELSHKALLDPEGFCLQHNVPVSAIPREITLLREKQPLVTLLERVRLGGNEYFIDKHGLAFLDTLDMKNRLFFHWFKEDKDGGLSLLYNRETRTVAGSFEGEKRKDWQHIAMPPAEIVSPNLEAAAEKKKLVALFQNKIAGTAALREVAQRKRHSPRNTQEFVRKHGTKKYPRR